jgi:Leucine-rich repeat (LRR) protein
MTAKIFGNSYDINAKTLILYDTKLEYLPESISKFVNLKILNLSRNNLVVLPSSIGKVINLNYLYLPYNRLTTIPESIGELINLKELHLQNNQLANLPESIGNLVGLQELWLDNNQLTSLPKSILNIKNSLYILENSYKINDLSSDAEILLFFELDKELTNLPINLKELWIKEAHKNEKLNHKIPFGCVIKYY